MGFEVTYHYFDRDTESGKYNMEDSKTISRKVGDPFEDVSLEELAPQIMAQLSRRDIMIHDVEIFELTKKSISFRETKGGFVIKNKKFTLDEAADNLKVVASDEVVHVGNGNHPVVSTQVGSVSAATMSAATGKKNVVPQLPVDESRPKAFLEYNPEGLKRFEIEKKGFRFTVGQKYPIFSVRDGNMLGIKVYTTKDDSGKLRELEDDCFIMPRRGLVGEAEVGGFSAGNGGGGNLMYQGTMDSEMPNLRATAAARGPVRLPPESQQIMEQMAKAQEMPVLRPNLTRG